MRLIERITKPTPKKNRIIGQISTFLFTLLLAYSQAGLIENKWIVITLEVLSVKFGIIALYNAQKVDKDI